MSSDKHLQTYHCMTQNTGLKFCTFSRGEGGAFYFQLDSFDSFLTVR